MADWQFEERDPRYIEQDPTQRDQFNNDDVSLADAIVRETIQNSSDAGDGGAPVKVRFQVRVIAADQQAKFRQLFAGLRPHLAACGIDPARIDQPNPRVLVVEDFETKGLTGDPGALDGGNFHSFWRRLGKSGKTGRLLGRWGLGKLVYSSSSDIRSFFGLTVRAGDSTPLLMGQAVLSNHDIGRKRYVAHAFWFNDRNADHMQMPITDGGLIAELSRMWGISRISQPGLSIVVPFLSANIDEQVLLRGVLENYYFPILAGRLSVEVGSRVVNADNFLAIAKEVLADSAGSAQRFAFVAQVSSALAEKPAFQAKPLSGAQKFSSEIFHPDDVTKMKAVFGRGDLLHVRLPVRLRRKTGEESQSYVDLFLKALPENVRPFALFARGSITVPGEAKFFRDVEAYGAFVGLDEDVMAFLGDAENPAHTTWSGTAEKVNANWQNAGATLRFLRYALWELYNIVGDQGNREDRDALLDFFALEDLTRSVGRRRDKPPAPPPEIRSSEKAMRIQKKGPGGFAIIPGPAAAEWSFPKAVKVRVAYDILGGNPFSKHSPYDFDLTGDGIEIEATNMLVRKPESNVLELEISGPDFRLEASGFDTNRDLVVDARARP